MILRIGELSLTSPRREQNPNENEKTRKQFDGKTFGTSTRMKFISERIGEGERYKIPLGEIKTENHFA